MTPYAFLTLRCATATVAGFSMNTAEKIRMARQLAKLGVDVIEAGFPIASRGDLDAVRLVAQESGTFRLRRWRAPKKKMSPRRLRRWNPPRPAAARFFGHFGFAPSREAEYVARAALEAIASMIRSVATRR